MKWYQLVVSIFLLSYFVYPNKVAANAESERFVEALCEYAKINHRSTIRKKLKSARLKLRKVYSSIRCEGQSFYEYAKANNAEDVVKYIEAKVKPEKR